MCFRVYADFPRKRGEDREMITKEQLQDLQRSWATRPRLNYGDTRKWQKDTLQYLANAHSFLGNFTPKMEQVLNILELELKQKKEK